MSYKQLLWLNGIAQRPLDSVTVATHLYDGLQQSSPWQPTKPSPCLIISSHLTRYSYWYAT